MYVPYFIATALLIGVIGLFLSAMSDLFSMFLNIRVVQDITYPPEKLAAMQVYLKDHPYFQNLSPKGKTRFMYRTLNVMVNKNFIGKGIAVTEEMRVRLSACVVQLTFGLKEYTLPHYDRIYIFPEDYYHPLMRQRLKGGTYVNGMISFSWKDFVEGFADPFDHFNLGLHEFAHALKLEINHGEKPDERFSDLFPEWHTRGKYELEKMKITSKPYLRDYAATNIDEFFAVSVEYFFERPEEFKSAMPELFSHLCWLLNQNPLHVHTDYNLSAVAEVRRSTIIAENANLPRNASSDVEGAHASAIPEPVPLLPPKTKPLPYPPATYKQITGKLHWATTIMISGPFLGIPAIVYLTTMTAIQLPTILFIIAGITALNLITWKYFKRRGFADYSFFSAYSLLGVGIWGMAFILALNYMVPQGASTHTANRIYRSDIPKNGQSGIATFKLIDDAYGDYPMLNTIWFENNRGTRPVRVDRTFRTGLFGFETLRKTEFFYEQK